MPRAKIEHKANVKHSFDDGECLIRSVGEVMASRIEQAARLLAMGREAGDSASMEVASEMRLKAVRQIDEWAGKTINRQVKAAKGAETFIRDQQKKNAKVLKRDLALAEIDRLAKMGKEPKVIPGMLDRQGICSARYARSLLEKSN